MSSSSRSSNEHDYEKGKMSTEDRVQLLDMQNEKTDAAESTLPSPATATTSSKPKLSAATIIPIWIVLSSSVIIYNNYLYNTLQFRFPVFLVTWHLTFAVSFALLLFISLGHSSARAEDGCRALHPLPKRHILDDPDWATRSFTPQL